MPPLLCASPCILDQSFPRDSCELEKVAQALGDMEELLSQELISLVLPDSLGEFVIDIDWYERGPQYPLLIDIHRLLTQWFLQPHSRLVRIDTSDVLDWRPHPLPEGTIEDGWVLLWAEEIGKLLVKHDRSCGPGFCIGIACEKGFQTNIPGDCRNPDGQRCFPLVGPSQIVVLEDAYDWESLPDDCLRKPLSIDKALQNVNLLGATKIEEPHRDSHYKIHFPSSRPWTLGRNIDPVPDRFVRELVVITGLPFGIVRATLVYGVRPKKNVLRLS